MSTIAADIKTAIAAANEAVADVEDAALKEIAYGTVLEYLLEHPQTDATEDEHANSSSDVPAGSLFDEYADEEWDGWPFRSEQDRADAVAAYFSIAPEQTADLFDLKSEEPAVRLPWAEVPSDCRAAARKVALLVVGLRAALGLDATENHVSEGIRAHRVPHASEHSEVVREMDEFKILCRHGRAQPIVRLNEFGVEQVRAAVVEMTAQ